METNDKLVVTENRESEVLDSIKQPNFSGFFIQKFRERMLDDEPADTVDQF